MKKNVICMVLGLLFLSGCATVEFYSDEGLQKKTGIRYYAPKPYLLVIRTGAKDTTGTTPSSSSGAKDTTGTATSSVVSPITVSVVYLPNLEDKQFAVYRPGWGSNQFSLSLSNGILTSYGQTTDSKIPETISAIGSLASSAAAATTSILKALGPQPQALDRATLDNAAKQMEDIAKNLEDAMGKPGLTITTEQQDAGKGLVADLKSLAARLKDPQASAKLPGILADLKSLGNDKRWTTLQLQGGQGQAANFNAEVQKLQNQVTSIADMLSPSTPKVVADFELYEIKQDQGKTSLIRVEVPK